MMVKVVSRPFTVLLSSMLAFVLAMLSISLIFAAPAASVYVDAAGSCGGRPTCFSTVQAGVNNASADTTLYIYPGVYAESVDLALMGSAVNQPTGNLKLRSVNSGGFSTAGTVKLDPPSGAALHTSEDFAGTLDIYGLEIVSGSGEDGLNLNVAGSVTLHELFVHDAGDEGIDLNIKLPANQMAPAIEIENSTVHNSGGDGYRLRMVTGTIEIINSIATANASDGFDLDTDMPITLTHVTASDNGKSGILARDASRVFIRNATMSNNADDGIDIDSGVGDVRIEDSEARENGDDGYDLRAKDDVRIHRSTAANNAEQGFEVGANDNVEIHNSTSQDNGLDGIGIYTYTNPVNDIQIEGNLIINNNRFRASAGGIGIYADLRDSGGFAINSNVICQNEVSGLYIDAIVPMTPTLSAQGNWWGSDSGPNGSNNRISDAPDIVDGGNHISTGLLQPSQLSVVGTTPVNMQFTDSSGSWGLHKGIGDPNGSTPFTIGVAMGWIVGANNGGQALSTFIDADAQALAFTFDPSVAYPTEVNVGGPCGLQYSGVLEVINDTNSVTLVSAETTTQRSVQTLLTPIAILLSALVLMASTLRLIIHERA